MIYLVVAVLLALCTLATIAPLRPGAACTPATHRGRQLLGGACALACAYGVFLFVRFIVVEGHPVTTNVVVGRVVDVVLGVHAFVLLRGVFPKKPAAIVLAAVSVALACAAVVHAVIA